MKGSERNSQLDINPRDYSSRELIPLINKVETKITMTTMTIIHNKEIPITAFSVKPKENPNFEIIIPEPFQNEWPKIAINSPNNND